MPDRPSFLDAPRQNSDSADRLREELSASTVHIFLQDGSQGSGFIADKSGYVVTAAHVVKDFPNVVIVARDQSGQRSIHQASVRSVDAANDIAVLKMDKPPPGAKPVRFGESLDIQPGTMLYSFGHRLGANEASIGSGQYQFHLRMPEGDYKIMTAPQTQPGASGGPLTTADGRVLGVVRGGNSECSAFAPSETVAELLAKAVPDRFSVNRKPSGWAGDHLSLLQEKPYFALLDAGLLGAGGYGAYRLAAFRPGLTAAGTGVVGTALLFNDTLGYLGANNDRERTKCTIGAALDGGIIAGAGLAALKRTKAGLAIAAVAGLSRIATEFYPTRTQLNIKDN